jgi:hypothetical protein
MLSPAMAEEPCGGSLEEVMICVPGKPWTPAPEPWQWLQPWSKKTDLNGVPLTPFDRGDAANQLVGVMTDIVFKAQKCPAIKPNFALFGTMMLTLGVRQCIVVVRRVKFRILYQTVHIKLLQIVAKATNKQSTKSGRCITRRTQQFPVRIQELTPRLLTSGNARPTNRK